MTNGEPLDVLKQELISVLGAVEYHRARDYPDWSGQENELLSCPMTERHEDGDDSTPSLAISPDSGAFYCNGCAWKGTSIVGYHTDVHCEGNFRKALGQLYSKHVRPLYAKQEYAGYHDNLLARNKLIQRLTLQRGWTKKTVVRFNLGWLPSKKRVVIPITNRAGMCVDLRFHDSLHRAPLRNGKRIGMLAPPGGHTGDWFPLVESPFDARYPDIWITEGEPDTILAVQEGLNAVTLTGGCNVWKGVDFGRLSGFEGKHVFVCLDNDKAGQQASLEVAKRLSALNIASLKIIRLPQGNDVTDFFIKHGGGGDQLRQIASATVYTIKPRSSNVASVALAETSRPEHIGKWISTNVVVNGKHSAPYHIPRRMKISCNTPGSCDNCLCIDGDIEHFVTDDDPDMLEWLIAKDPVSQIKKEYGITGRCPIKVNVLEWMNLEPVTMIPALTSKRSEDEAGYAVRAGYHIGVGIDSNQSYRIRAMPVVHPRTKESTLLVAQTKGTTDVITTFKLTPEEIKRLGCIFESSPGKTLSAISNDLSNHVTKIYQRSLLHTVVDLCFHSPLDFSFGGVHIPKGSIELLLFGDTRCGKGQVAEGLVRFYDLGAVVSGENASFMGLAGGASKSGDSFQLVWGALPINHRRLVVIDECSGLGADVLGKLSRIRSEGIAELHKGGINASTNANTRLIWITNPKGGREVASYPSGVAAIKDLLKAAEDIARFDLAMVLRTGEVGLEEMNTLHHTTTAPKYKQSDLRKVLLWVWSRTHDQIMFTRQATEFILESAVRLANRYSSAIPLIQGENARFKLAKLAAAIAGRTFSTPDGIFLKVEKMHAILAEKIIRKLYDGPTMGYAAFSAIEKGTNQLIHLEDLLGFFKQWPVATRKGLVDGMLTSNLFGVNEMQDWCRTDNKVAKQHCGLLLRSQCLKPVRGGYIARPAFLKYLRNMKRAL